jgi:hypothetical protein
MVGSLGAEQEWVKRLALITSYWVGGVGMDKWIDSIKPK